MDKISCILIGNGVLTVQCATVLEHRGHRCRAVVSNNRELIAWATERKIAAYPDPKTAEQAFVATPAPADYVLSIANLEILGDGILKQARIGGINFHDGPLPRYAGIHATSWAIMAGEQQHGVTWHRIGGRVDEGGLLLQREVAIAPDESAYTLNTKCLDAAMTSFGELLNDLEHKTLKELPQELSQRSYFGKFQRPAGEGFLDWSLPAAGLAALVRGLDFGPYPNRLASAKMLLTEGRSALVAGANVDEASPEGAAPGTILALEDDGIVVATSDGSLRIKRLKRSCGAPLELAEAIRLGKLEVGGLLPTLSASIRESLGHDSGKVARAEARWVSRLSAVRPLDLHILNRDDAAAVPLYAERKVHVPAPAAGHDAATAVAAFGILLWRLTNEDSVSVGCWPVGSANPAGLFARVVPLNLVFEGRETAVDLIKASRAEMDAIAGSGPGLLDVFARYPEIANRHADYVRLARAAGVVLGAAAGDCDAALQLIIDDSGRPLLRWDTSRVTEWDAGQFVESFETILAAILEDDSCLARELNLLSKKQRSWLLAEQVPAPTVIPADFMHSDFERNADRTPAQIALVFHEQQLSYSGLNERADHLAARLRELGVGPDQLVGIFMERSLDLMVALYGVLKAGGAYLPLDPAYPEDRLAFMIEDSGAGVVLTDARWKSRLPKTAAKVLTIDEACVMTGPVAAAVTKPASPEHLAYVIYTSGSTGKPKGVMVTHRNAVNFFLGMDQRLGAEPGVWLAVTSISFDISVLELFWTLARGFKVVLAAEDDRLAMPQRVSTGSGGRVVDFSLFYFASEIGGEPNERYKLLIEGAKYGDENGFAAVWTPERHFHSFGGLYSNPSVASAALATLTKRIGIRAGSVVSPLHHPVRLAEEWALVDNLSHGRVGISFASGWQANDFIFAPERYADRKRIMLDNIETVRKLWRGEAVSFTGGDGKEVGVRIFPTPIQPELPVWVTAAGNPETFRQAGEIGANILTHLLGQKIEDVEEKVEIYRQAWAKAGHPGRGHATLMLHTYVGRTMEEVKEMVRGPMCRYLGTSLDLIRNAPFAFPTYKVPSTEVAEKVEQGLRSFSPADMEVLLGFAFERYFESSGLFGTVERCVEISERCRDADVDEIGCLIDYGVPVDAALAGLRDLNEVRQRVNQPPAETSTTSDYSLIGQIRTHGVTHLQCTPSLARLVTGQPGGLEALGGLRRLMLGGEALPGDLISQLRPVVRGEIHNMYGPTETTVWSSTDRLPPAEDFITIGSAIANTSLYVVDRRLQLLPPGIPGELLIGGDGVTRGYLNRASLTQEKFIADRYGARNSSDRAYRTGDLVAWRSDGRIDFLGRLDHQVKIRGFRIEIGEIEHFLSQHPRLRSAVVVPRPRSGGETDLAAFYVATGGSDVDVTELRRFLGAHLPDYMIPGTFTRLGAFPTTPNGKIDRKTLVALPVTPAAAPTAAVGASPDSELAKSIAAVFVDALELSGVGMDQNFFDLGANSLTLVRVASRLGELFPGRLGLVDLFQHTTIRSLVEFLSDPKADASAAAGRAADRGRQRRESLLQRRRR